MIFKMEVLLHQMAPQDVIWLALVKVPRLAEVETDWICTLTAEIRALQGGALGSRHQMEFINCLPILHPSREQAARV
jgi:hypothetical protein